MAAVGLSELRVCHSKVDSVELILILFPETVTSGEKLPTTFLVHFPYVRLLKDREEEERRVCFMCVTFKV